MASPRTEPRERIAQHCHRAAAAEVRGSASRRALSRSSAPETQRTRSPCRLCMLFHITDPLAGAQVL